MLARQSPSRSLAAYGALALPIAFAGVPLYLHAPDYYAQNTPLTLSVIGASLLVLRLIDAVQDPLIGVMSDKFRHHRQTIMHVGALLLCVGFWMVFHPPQSGHLVWFFAAIFVSTTGYSILSINLLASGGEWASPSLSRVSINGSRESFTLLGVMTASALPSLLALSMTSDAVFNTMSIALIIIVIPALLLYRYWYQETIPQRLKSAQDQLVRLHWPSSTTRNFYIIYTLSQFASALPAVLVIFFVRDLLQAEAWTGLFLLLYFLAAAVSMLLWQRLACRVDNVSLWRISMVMASIIFLFAGFLGSGDVVLFSVICVLSGCALGAELCLPPSILTDMAEQQDRRHLLNQLFAQMTFLGKLALALATGIALPAIQWAGYHPASDAAAIDPSSLSYGYAIIPACLKLATALLSFRLLSEVSSGVPHEIRSSANGRPYVS